ncbi:Icy1p NDAI_0I00680 [Naumovozyma dairenensis CBS 421]|uniref:Uncharacterized protein n=1 Tax=Naumovozyma dairenensis (strain ATCC 10597 / BCRC 20456 / CBS 421 / NBRC 0211 / NRRL Y-12639) TaxID=1071378 RepID=G0WFS6_NAUDC|nr:hypothetical protein NDAI_0I00680 [Naumovozyma dairenensis CBS 421]CCD26637.1 hypothetical protein NDAI_0I00680 [Naumovozyma dairenensis CBS 421]
MSFPIELIASTQQDEDVFSFSLNNQSNINYMDKFHQQQNKNNIITPTFGQQSHNGDYEDQANLDEEEEIEDLNLDNGYGDVSLLNSPISYNNNMRTNQQEQEQEQENVRYEAYPTSSSNFNMFEEYSSAQDDIFEIDTQPSSAIQTPIIPNNNNNNNCSNEVSGSYSITSSSPYAKLAECYGNAAQQNYRLWLSSF